MAKVPVVKGNSITDLKPVFALCLNHNGFDFVQVTVGATSRITSVRKTITIISINPRYIAASDLLLQHNIHWVLDKDPVIRIS